MSQDYTDDCFDSTHATQTDMANIEKSFAALKSAFSGANQPSNMIAGMNWLDTTAHIWKMRNEANNAWLSIWDFANNKPMIANLSNEITGAMISSAIKDPAVGTYGLRRLGTGSQQAGAGNVVAANTAKVTNATHTGDVTGATALTIGAAKVNQAKLKTSQGSVSRVVNGNSTLPGGEYGFYPRVKVSSVDGSWSFQIAASIDSTSYITNIRMTEVVGGYTGYAQQRYIASSGEIHWIFILRDKITKQTIAMYQAPDHPCFGNGGKPLLMAHPFGDYNETRHEIIVINPPLEEIERMELETIIDDEMKPDKDLLEVITENYEIDENSNPKWPDIPVTVGLSKHVKDKKTGKKILADYRFMPPDTIVEPIKKIIPKPSYIKVKKLRRK